MQICFVNCQEENLLKAAQVGSRVSWGGGWSWEGLMGSSHRKPSLTFQAWGAQDYHLSLIFCSHLSQPICPLEPGSLLVKLCPPTSAHKGLRPELQALQESLCPPEGREWAGAGVWDLGRNRQVVAHTSELHCSLCVHYSFSQSRKRRKKGNVDRFREDPPGEGQGNPLQYSCLKKPMNGGAWWATVHGVAKNQTGLRD